MKLVYRIAVVVALAVLAAGTAIIACELRRLNTNIEDIRSQIPMSLLGN